MFMSSAVPLAQKLFLAVFCDASFPPDPSSPHCASMPKLPVGAGCGKLGLVQTGLSAWAEALSLVVFRATFETFALVGELALVAAGGELLDGWQAV